MTRRPLPDIRELTDDPTPDWSRRRTTFAWLAMGVAAIGLLSWSASIAWEALTDFGVGSRLAAASIGAVLAVAAGGAVDVIRRNGFGMVPYLAVIYPVVAWILVCVLILVVGSLEADASNRAGRVP